MGRLAARLAIESVTAIWQLSVLARNPRHSGRAELFATIDKPALKNLPDEPYAFAVWKRCRVAPDHHVEVDGHWFRSSNGARSSPIRRSPTPFSTVSSTTPIGSP